MAAADCRLNSEAGGLAKRLDSASPWEIYCAAGRRSQRKTAIIPGSNSVIGLECARRLLVGIMAQALTDPMGHG